MKMIVGGKWQHKGESQQARKNEGNTSRYWATGTMVKQGIVITIKEKQW